jgi:hypothetical protein
VGDTFVIVRSWKSRYWGSGLLSTESKMAGHSGSTLRYDKTTYNRKLWSCSFVVEGASPET